jgi:AraC-like DNA-binding protein
MVAAESDAESLESMLSRHSLGLVAETPKAIIPFQLMKRMFNDAAYHIGDERFGGRVGLAMTPEAFGPFMRYALTAGTLREAIARSHATEPLHTNASRTFLATKDGMAHLTIRYARGCGPQLDQHALHVLTCIMVIIRRYAGANSSPTEMHVVDAYAPSARRLEECIGTEVRARSDRYSVVFPASWLDIPKPAADRSTNIHIEDQPFYDRLIPRGMTDAVRMAFGRHTAAAQARLDTIATELGLPRRTVQNALRFEGMSFRQIRNEAGMARAQHLLATTRQSIAEIAFCIGYSDQSHFHRTFVDVVGLTPKHFRTSTQMAAS